MVLAGCSSDDIAPETGGYGYLQVRLRHASTRSVVEGNTLVKLGDAKKVKLSLRYHGKVMEQTLNLQATSAQAAEFELTSEEIKLLDGNYQLLGYALYGDYRNGDMAPVLQVVQMDEATEIVVQRDRLTQQMLQVDARQYGRFSAQLIRLEPEVTRAGAPTLTEYFSYADVDSVQLILQRSVSGVNYSESHRVKAYRADSDAPVFNTDSMELQTGQYSITHFELFNRRGQFMYAQDVTIPFEVKHYELARADVGVQLPTTQGTLDGIALRQIWDAMDGPNWSFHDQDGYGSNWVFTMSDGSPRPLSAWVRQPGVVVNASGRVISLNLGAFNPMGDVPDAIGQLDALERLYLGEHTDEVYYTLEGVGGMHYTLSPYILSKRMDVREHRMDIARERALIRSLGSDPASQSALLYKGKSITDAGVQNLKYASRVQTGSYDPANRITGISEQIGKLKNLTELYIANSMIQKLPTSMAELTGVTDLELYNNPLTELDGEVFRGMQYLTSVNIDRLFNLSETQILQAMDKMCEYCPRVQLLYLCNEKLTRLPEKLNRLADLRLLDVSHNRIKQMGSLLPMAPIQVILDHNELETLPADLFNVDDIELFSCTDNRLKEFPAVLSNAKGLYAFDKVNLTGNRMHGFQSGFEGIRTEQLLMAGNYMGRRPGETTRGEFPREFAETGSVMNYLDISHNYIDTIRNVALKGLSSIQALDLSKNDLRYMPSAFNAETFPWLTGLDVSRNRLEGFPNNVLNVLSLQQLLISDQGYFRDEAQTQWVRTMTEWPEYLHLHSSLSNVDMSGNDFRTVTNFPSNLVTLNVTNNPHIRMVVPQDVLRRMQQGLFVLYCDEDQDITVE